MKNLVITKENIVRIKDKKLLIKLNEYLDKYDYYNSKNEFMNELIKHGIEIMERREKDNWAIKQESQTILDAIHEHTKRMNYFIKFSKPFIKSCYANGEINQKLLNKLLCISKMELSDAKKYEILMKSETMEMLDSKLELEKKKLCDLYDYKVDWQKWYCFDTKILSKLIKAG